jgi:hypothetical protein
MTPEELTDIGTAKYGKWGWQRRLAAELGINPNTVLRWKSGHTPINDAMAFRLRDGKETAETNETPQDFRAMLRTLARNPNLTVVEDGIDFRIVERDKIV